MEEGIKEKRFLVLACVVFGIAIALIFKFLSIGIDNGFDTSLLLKISPFAMIAIAMIIYIIGLLIKKKGRF